jgi:hypothetical protein
MAEDKISAQLEEFCEKCLLDAVGEPVRYGPRNWAQQHVDVTATERPRYRDGTRGVTRDGRDADRKVTALDLEQKKRLDERAVTLIEVRYDCALAASDATGRETAATPHPRNRGGGWHFPTKWPPGHGAEVSQGEAGMSDIKHDAEIIQFSAAARGRRKREKATVRPDPNGSRAAERMRTC